MWSIGTKWQVLYNIAFLSKGLVHRIRMVWVGRAIKDLSRCNPLPWAGNLSLHCCMSLLVADCSQVEASLFSAFSVICLIEDAELQDSHLPCPLASATASSGFAARPASTRQYPHHGAPAWDCCALVCCPSLSPGSLWRGFDPSICTFPVTAGVLNAPWESWRKNWLSVIRKLHIVSGKQGLERGPGCHSACVLGSICCLSQQMAGHCDRHVTANTTHADKATNWLQPMMLGDKSAILTCLQF